MRGHYDFSKMKREKSPYIKDLKQPFTTGLDKASVTYIESMATDLEEFKSVTIRVIKKKGEKQCA